MNAQDVFGTKNDVPPSPGAPLVVGKAIPADLPPEPLTLETAAERALENNPKTRQAWAAIKAQAANVGIARAAYLPTLSGTAQGTRDTSNTNVNLRPDLNTDTWSTQNSESASLSWVLYDFGGREAALKNAKELLFASQASHQATLQDVFFTTAKDYYATQSAQDTVNTGIENERTAQESAKAAKERVDKGVSPISDELQAENAHVQAVVNLTKTEGDWKGALGTLAVDMGLRPDTSIALPITDQDIAPGKEFDQSVSALIDVAVSQHPSVREAEAQLAAADAKIKQIRDGGMPTVSLIGKTSRNDVPVSQSLGLPSYDSTQRDTYVGLQISLPIFEGFSRTYQIRQAEAQAESQRHALELAQQQVGLQVWVSYQALQTASQNLQNNAALLDIAQKSYDAAQARYLGGVGSMIEWLSAQSALASAKLQRVQAISDWKTSRLKLASTLGQLGMWQLKKG